MRTKSVYPFYYILVQLTMNIATLHASICYNFVSGAVITHANIHAQISSLTEAWGWTEKDIVLHTLPLHHIHGIVNVLMCPLAVGGRYSLPHSVKLCDRILTCTQM
jgi:hypothetical protein